jgi:hypothetical protein
MARLNQETAPAAPVAPAAAPPTVEVDQELTGRLKAILRPGVALPLIKLVELTSMDFYAVYDTLRDIPGIKNYVRAGVSVWERTVAAAPPAAITAIPATRSEFDEFCDRAFEPEPALVPAAQKQPNYQSMASMERDRLDKGYAGRYATQHPLDLERARINAMTPQELAAARGNGPDPF